MGGSWWVCCSISRPDLDTCPPWACRTAYNAGGQLIGALGASTPLVLAGLPLPLPLCWAYLLISSARLRAAAPLKRAAGALVPLFVIEQPGRPVWEQHPMDALRLRAAAVAAAPAPLARAFAQAMLAFVASRREGSGGDTVAARAPAGAHGAGSAKALLCTLSEPRLGAQLAALLDCKRALIAMQVRGAWGALPLEGVLSAGSGWRPESAALRCAALRLPRAEAPVHACVRRA